MHRTYPKPRRYKDRFGDLWIDGEFFMGRNRVPSMPNRIALTDRTTGSRKVLSHTGASPELVNIQPRWSDVVIYDPFFGPINQNWRLVLDNDTLSFEPITGSTTYDSARILTRKNFETTVLELTVNIFTGNIVYTQVAL